MSARNLIEVDPGCGIGSSCRLIDSPVRDFPSESSQFDLTRPAIVLVLTSSVESGHRHPVLGGRRGLRRRSAPARLSSRRSTS